MNLDKQGKVRRCLNSAGNARGGKLRERAFQSLSNKAVVIVDAFRNVPVSNRAEPAPEVAGERGCDINPFHF